MYLFVTIFQTKACKMTGKAKGKQNYCISSQEKVIGRGSRAFFAYWLLIEAAPYRISTVDKEGGDYFVKLHIFWLKINIFVQNYT